MTLLNHVSVEYSPENSETLTVDHCIVPCSCYCIVQQSKVSYLYIFKLLTTCFLINSTAVFIIHQSIVCTIITISSKNTCSITYQSTPPSRIPDSRLTRHDGDLTPSSSSDPNTSTSTFPYLIHFIRHHYTYLSSFPYPPKIPI